MGNENSNEPTKNDGDYRQIPHENISNKLYEEFFIDLHKRYSISNLNDISMLNPKRIVFISITNLHKSWRRCPSIALYNSIIILPFKRDWIITPDKYTHIYSALLQDPDFLMLLRWKDHQHMAVFLLDTSSSTDEHNTNEEHKAEYGKYVDHNLDSISPVWRQLSALLQTLHDPVSTEPNGRYNPLIFSTKYWRDKASINTEEVEEILTELVNVSMKFKPISHILQESNPSLNVIINYVPELVLKESDETKTPNDEFDDSVLDSNWWIADDYYEDENDKEAVQQFHEYIDNNVDNDDDDGGGNNDVT